MSFQKAVNVSRRLAKRPLILGLTLVGWSVYANETDLTVFDYDSKKLLAVEEKVVKKLADLTISDISFDGGRNDRASGFYVAPRNEKEHAVVIFAHELGASRTEFLSEAMQLARTGRGAASVLIDAPWNKPAPWLRTLDPDKADNDRELQLTAIANLRRAVDFALSRPGANPKSVAFVGHSFGANWGSILAVAEPRISTYVLIAGVSSVTAAQAPDTSKRYIESIRTFDPELYLPRIRDKKLLLQFARYDLSVPEDAGKQFINLAGGQKQVLWYDCGHEMLDPRAIKERLDFLAKALHLR